MRGKERFVGLYIISLRNRHLRLDLSLAVTNRSRTAIGCEKLNSVCYWLLQTQLGLALAVRNLTRPAICWEEANSLTIDLEEVNFYRHLHIGRKRTGLSIGREEAKSSFD